MHMHFCCKNFSSIGSWWCWAVVGETGNQCLVHPGWLAWVCWLQIREWFKQTKVGTFFNPAEALGHEKQAVSSWYFSPATLWKVMRILWPDTLVIWCKACRIWRAFHRPTKVISCSNDPVFYRHRILLEREAPCPIKMQIPLDGKSAWVCVKLWVLSFKSLVVDLVFSIVTFRLCIIVYKCNILATW